MALKNCIKCNTDNKPDAVICINCGSSLKDSTIIGESKTDTNISYCPNCKEKLKSNSRNCSNCGTFIAKTNTTAYYSPNISQYVKRNRSNYSEYKKSYSYANSDESIKALLYIITFLMPVIGLIIGGVYTSSENPEKQNIGKTLLKFGLIMLVICGFLTYLILSKSANSLD